MYSRREILRPKAMPQLQNDEIKTMSTTEKLKKMFKINLEMEQPPGIDSESSKIDFKKLLQQHKDRTEKSHPFTLQQVEDVIFVSQRRMLALEYIFYQKDGNYHQIDTEKVPSLNHPLGLQSYDAKQKGNSVKAFQNTPTILEVKNIQYLDKFEDNFIDSDYSNVDKVEALLSLYRITPTGQIELERQKPIKYSVKYHQTKEGKMRLQLSQDLKYVSLCTQDHLHKVNEGDEHSDSSDSEESNCSKPGEKIEEQTWKMNCKLQLFAWNARTLEEKKLSEALQKKLYEQPNGQIVKIIFVGEKSQYLLQILKKHKHADTRNKEKFMWLHYSIIEVQTGNIVFEFENNFQREELRCLGFFTYVDAQQVRSDLEMASSSSNQNEQNLWMAFFFVKPFSKKNENDYGQKESWLCLNRFFSLGELANKSKDEVSNLLYSEAMKQYELFLSGSELTPKQKNLPEMKFPLLLPKNWFSKLKQKESVTEENWQQEISMTTNASFTKFAFIHKTKRTYVAFTPTNHNYRETKIIYPRKSYASHGRNQVTKEHLFFIQKTKNEGSTLTLIYNHQHSKQINFENDHFYCSPDINHYSQSKLQGNNLSESDRLMIQAVTITQDDQNIHLQGIYKLKNQGDYHLHKVSRKTNLQDVQAKFPVFAYNIGSHKLILLNTLSKGSQYVYHIAENEQFAGFVEFHNLKSLGFFADSLRIETCSQIVFLTLNMLNQQQIVNVLLVDPYYFPCKLALFRSSKTFAKNLNDLRCHDQPVKHIVFCSAKNQKDENFDVKLLTQYHSHYSITDLAACLDDRFDFDYDACDYFHRGTAEEEMQGKLDRSIYPVKMVMDPVKGSIFYTLYVDGICLIKEITPCKPEPKDHLTIFEIKADRCLGLSISKDSRYFFFINEFKQIIVMKRVPDTKLLVEDCELSLKDKDRTHLQVTDNFQRILMSQQYLVFESNIFYLQHGVQSADGILDVEKLNQTIQVRNDKLVSEKFQLGPFSIDGTAEFAIVFKDSSSYQIQTKIYQEPDSYQVSLIADYENKCEFSTFLKSGEILVKILNRFLVFDQWGGFIYQATYADIDKDLEAQEIQFYNSARNALSMNASKKSKNTEAQLRSISQKLLKTYGPIQSKQNQFSETYRKSYQRKKEDGDKKHQGQFEIPELNEDSDEDLINFKEELTDMNRMKLLKISRSNNFYLFEDRLKESLRVYRLDSISFSFFNKKQRIFQFVPLYSIDLREMELMDYIFKNQRINVKYIEYSKLINHILACGVLKVNDEGAVDISFNNYSKLKPTGQFEIIGSIIKKKNKCVVGLPEFNEYFFQRNIRFDSDGSQQIIEMLDRLLEEQKNLLEIELMYQYNLPENMKDSTRTEKLIESIKNLKFKQTNVVRQEILNQNLLVVSCGRFIKYLRIDIDNLDDEFQFTDMNIDFKPETEISRIQSTCNDDHLQIVATDIFRNLMMVVTWDIVKNMEVNMFQIVQEPKSYHTIVHGMQHSYNYFISESLVWDLQQNLPIMCVHDCLHPTQSHSESEKNLRKVFVNATKTLSIDKVNLLMSPTSRMDLVLWKNINDLGEKADIINNNTTIDHFSKIINGQSFFHYFVQNSDVVEVIHNKYMRLMENGIMIKNQKYIPLLMLNPDYDGKTALELAVELHRPKTFDLLLNLLAQFDEFCFSRMLLTVLPKMLQQETEVIAKYLNNCLFRAESMKGPLVIPWVEDMEQFVFACHTSIITEDIVKAQIEYPEKQRKSIRGAKVYSDDAFHIDKEIGSAKETGDDFLEKHQSLGFFKYAEDSKVIATRVRVYAIGIDWIFEGNNCENFLLFLVNHGDSSLFKTKAIKAFVNLLWKEFQPIIVKKIYTPYVFYLITQMIMSSGLAGAYFKILELPEDQFEKHLTMKWIIGSTIMLVCLIAVNLWWFFFKIEYMQFKKQPMEYFEDYNNWIDLTSQVTSISFFIILDSTVCFNKVFVSIQTLRIWGGFACFLLWIKMFQWMRLFKATAHFITLVVEIFRELKTFNFMMLIIMAAFGNFYYTLNNNTEMTSDAHFVGNYTRIQLLDAIIQMFIFSMGETDIEAQRSNSDHVVGFVLFILSTFILFVIFMNLIIAIVNDTYDEVKKRAEESSLQEQANLIADFIWLLDVKELFDGKKYIIVVETEATIKNVQVDLHRSLTDLQMQLSQKEDQGMQMMTKRIDDFEKSSRSMQKATYTIALKNKEQIVELDRKLGKAINIQKDIEQLSAAGHVPNSPGDQEADQPPPMMQVLNRIQMRRLKRRNNKSLSSMSSFIEIQKSQQQM